MLDPIPPPRGWPLLPTPDADGRLRFPSLEKSVREGIQVVLSTRFGERLMRPDFGAGLDAFLSEPNTMATRRRLRDTVASALSRWEDRIDVEGIEVIELPDEPSAIRVEIHYRLRRTGATQQVSLALDLEQP